MPIRAEKVKPNVKKPLRGHRIKVGEVHGGKTVLRVDRSGKGMTQEKAGRPKKFVFDEAQLAVLKSLVTIGCTNAEMAQVMGCSTDTLEEQYMDVIKGARLERNTTVRRRQWQLAMGDPKAGIQPNCGMLIWFGKQWLGQRDQMLLGEDSDNPFKGGAAPVIEIVFVESDGDGRMKTVEGTVTSEAPQLTNGGGA